ncbi:hypothetical protein, partial [Polaromonas sp. P5_E6]
MSLLKDLVTWTERIDGLNGLAEGIKKLDEADNGIDVAAASSQIVAELAVAAALTATVRTAMSLTRLGLAISGNIWKWEALSKVAGISGGLTAGAIIDGVNALGIGGKIYDWTHVDPLANTRFFDARNIVVRRDPLVMDLDGDGLELTGASGSILFDHNGDGIKTGTGWARPDDGFLVRDLNGNGTIDTGRELFGVDTIKSNSTL